MRIDARLEPHGTIGPDPWEDSWGIQLPLDHIICRDVDGTPHSIQEFIWPWTAYTKDHKRLALHFYYWKQKRGPLILDSLEVNPEREARIRELQFLMTRQIYYANENAPQTLVLKISVLYTLARFAEARSCTIRDVLTETSLLDACGANMPDHQIPDWMYWIKFLRQLDPTTQLGFSIATQKRWKDLERRKNFILSNQRQHAPLPTRIYGGLINNLSTEFDDIEAHAPRLLAALRDAIMEYERATVIQRSNRISVGPSIIEKHRLGDYLTRRGFNIASKALNALSGAVSEIFLVCKLQIHSFSGMRHDEAKTLPFHCMVKHLAGHGRTHSMIAGVTSKFNKGRPLRAHWVTTDCEGFRAVRLAMQFASVIYESLDLTPSKDDAHKDNYPVFPSTNYLPWFRMTMVCKHRVLAANMNLNRAKKALLDRLIPVIEEQDIAELEEIDPFRAWRDEMEFAIGQRWPLTTHQLRRSLAVYANASGLVRFSSLRRQLQHITREMSLYYGRGSTFCKNFIAYDPDGFKKHVAPVWQDGSDEAMMLAFTRDVLNSNEPMFGGAGNFYQRQKERGEVMSREDVKKQMKAGLLSYRSGPLGGCTKPGRCDKRKGLDLIDISCVTEGCKNLVGKHSKIIRVIQLKRASVAHITQGSIEAEIEREELETLERVEREWRPQATPPSESITV
ncbi:MAG: hypothetical protein KIT07_01090 [Anaerolineales bacterium]|nr:hypothetical protein [Rhodocyclaceae bacterium]MCW5886702.1 hypothetical protein [Anaerolineales bacterium]